MMKLFTFAIAVCLTAPAAAQQVTDPQIASIVVTANQVDIDAGKLAASRSKNPDVKKFGELMVADHTGVNTSAIELVKKLNVTPQDNPTSQSLKSGGETNVAHLKTLNGAEFDKAYVDHEVVYHQQVLDAIDKTLVPNASNAELKALLVKVRPAIAAHLDHAKTLQASLSAKHTATIDGTAFMPKRISVKVGDSVTWTNKDPFAHTVTSRAAGFDSKTMASGASWTYRATRAGEFPYVCTLHPTMTGTLIVE
jgi:putative membrane protein